MRHTGALVWKLGVLKQEKAAGSCVSAAGSHRSAKPSGRAFWGRFRHVAEASAMSCRDVRNDLVAGSE